MSTLASLAGMLGDTQIRPWSQGMESVNRAALGGQEVETGLIKLAQLKQSQASEAEVMAAIQRDPSLQALLFGGGGSTIGSLPTTGGPPAPGPLTQQTTTPGQPPGAPQVVPGGQDLSRFAQVPPTGGGPIPPDVARQVTPTVTPPGGMPGTPTLATIGPQGGMPGAQQGPMQGPQNPVLEMARTNPRAAMMLQSQIEGRQDAEMKRQEQRLKMGATIMASLGRRAQGATDQASWDLFRQDAASIDPRMAAQLPQVYSKEARDRVVAQALEVKDRMALDIAALKEQTDLRTQRFKEQQAAAGVPEYVKGEGAPALNVAIDRRMQQAGIPRGTPPSEAILTQAQQDVETAKVRVSASQGTGQIVKGPTGEYIRVKPGTDQVEVIKGPGGEPLREKPSETEQRGATLANSVAAANTLATELEEKGYKPSVWDKGLDKLPLGLGNYVTSSDYQKYRQTVNEFASAWLYGVSGAQINDDEWERANQTFFPQPNEDKGAVDLKRQRRAALVEQLRQQTQATGRTGTQTQPTSQGSAKPVGQMSPEEIRAEIAEIKKRGGS